MRRPFLLPALGFAFGIGLAEWAPTWAILLYGLSACVLFLEARGEYREAWRRLAGWSFAGVLAWWIERTPLSECDLRLVPDETALVEVVGQITESQTLRLSPVRGETRASTTLPVKVSARRVRGEPWQRVDGEILTRTQGAAPHELFAGQSAHIQGVMRIPPSAVAPELFDYRTQLRYRGISRLLDVESFREWSVPKDSGTRSPWSARFLPWAQAALARGLPDDETTRLLWAMTLGWRTALTDETGEAFVESGTMHVFAISGLHIALLSALVVTVLRVARIDRAVCGLIAIPIGWLYVAATGWQPSAIRSAVMMSVVVGGWALRRPSDLLNSLAFSGLAILIWDPGQLFQPGFQLSFAAVAGLALWTPALETAWERLLRPRMNPFLPPALQPAWKVAIDPALRQLAQSLAISSAALLATLPFTVHYFHFISPISLVANLVVVPLSSLALAANVASLALFTALPSVSEIFNVSAWIWMKAMVGFSRWFAGWPGGVWAVAEPPVRWWIGYYVLLFGPRWIPITLGSRPRRYAAAGAALVGLAMEAFVALRQAQVTVLTLLPGSSILDAPGRSADLVLNCGSPVQTRRLLLPWLRAAGWNRIPTWVLTQAEARHLGGAPDLRQSLPVTSLALGPRRQRSPAFRDLQNWANEQRIPISDLEAGAKLKSWTVLSPANRDGFRTAEDNALVLLGEVGGFRIMYLPALGNSAIQTLLTRLAQTSQKADIVIAEMDPRRSPPPTRLWESLQPQLVIFTEGSSPPSVSPSPGWRRNRPSGAQVIHVLPDQSLSLSIAESGARLTLSTGETFGLAAPRPVEKMAPESVHSHHAVGPTNSPPR